MTKRNRKQNEKQVQLKGNLHGEMKQLTNLFHFPGFSFGRPGKLQGTT